MAQSREKRNRRRQQQRRAPAATPPSVGEVRRRNLRRVVIALAILIGLAGILAVSAPADEPSGRAPIG